MKRKRVIIVATSEYRPVAIVSSNIETLGQKIAEARSVQHRARRNNLVFRQTTELPRDPGHDVTRVGDDDDDSVRAVLDHFRNDFLEDSDILLYEVKT